MLSSPLATCIWLALGGCSSDATAPERQQPDWMPVVAPPRNALAFVLDAPGSDNKRSPVADFPVAFALLDDHTCVWSERDWSAEYQVFRAAWRSALASLEALRTGPGGPFSREALKMERVGLLER
jgi:hypothetical protein